MNYKWQSFHSRNSKGLRDSVPETKDKNHTLFNITKNIAVGFSGVSVQETQVWFLIPEDPTCHGATKPVHHNCWACALEPGSHSCWACALEPGSHSYWACVPLEPMLPNKRSPCSEKPEHRNYRAAPARHNSGKAWAATETPHSLNK